MLAWRFVGEAFLLSPLHRHLSLPRLSLAPPRLLVHSRVSYARLVARSREKREKQREGPRRNDEKTKRKMLRGCQGQGGERSDREGERRERERRDRTEFRIKFTGAQTLSLSLSPVSRRSFSPPRYILLARFFIGSSLHRILSLALFPAAD